MMTMKKLFIIGLKFITNMFKNLTHKFEFINNGFVIVDLLNNSEIELLSKLSKNSFVSQDELSFSIIDNDYEYNSVLNNTLSKLIFSKIKYYIENFRTLNFSFIRKKAKSQNELLLHQDWSYTEENKFFSANIWCPIIETSKTNGGLFLLNKSHTTFDNVRSNSFETLRIPVNTFQKKHITNINTKTGQAVIFDPRLFHGSYPNNTIKNRDVLVCTILDKKAPFNYFYKDDDFNAIQFKLKEDSFLKELTKIATGELPKHILTSEKINYVNNNSLKELIEKYL